ncbi:hypothetical protein RB195_000954 [Necator americanus]|uniref:Secreted protein n=1 Tax=Necator americanus TaxID=51031 RepID=A0ABR1DC46_NECAM
MISIGRILFASIYGPFLWFVLNCACGKERSSGGLQNYNGGCYSLFVETKMAFFRCSLRSPSPINKK